MKSMQRQARGVCCVSQGAALVALTLSSTTLRVTMDLFQHRYYRMNKILMELLGQWPYHSFLVRCSCVVAFLAIGGIQLLPLVLALVRYHNDRSVLLDGTLALLLGAVTMTKFIGGIGSSEKTLQLLNRIRMDWHIWAEEREVKFLHEYTEQGRKMAVAYIVINITNQSVFVAQPLVLKMIDRFLKNNTEPGTFPYPADFYLLDVEKYYYYIIVCMLFTGSTITTAVTCSGVMLICYAHHVCGIFVALGHKLEGLGNHCTLEKKGEAGYGLDEKDILLINSCIDRHNSAIEYVNLVEASYSWVFFFTIGFGEFLVNIIGLQILMRTNEPEAAIRYIVCVLSVTVYFYVDCYVSETVISHSVSIYFCIYNSKWYNLSLKAQKLLRILMMRGNTPCQLTAGSMLVMSMRSYWLTFKTSLSYLMFVRSMHELES